MFTIYNQLGKPLELISNLKTDKMIIIKKVPVKESAKSIDIKISKKLIFRTPVDLFNLKNKLDQAVNTESPVVVVDSSLSTIFNRSDFSPVILATGDAGKAIGVITLDIENKNIVGINDTQCFIFESICNKTELSLFVSINTPERPLIITLYDSNINKIVKYVFHNQNGRITLTTEISEVADMRMLKMKLKKRYNISKFRPAKPTYTILGLPNAKLPDIVGANLYNFIPIELVGDELNRKLNDLVVNKYSAVTIYTDKMTSTQISKALEKAKQFMLIVYSMDSEGKVKRHKVE